MTDEKVFQEKMLIYRTLESKLEALTKQSDIVGNKIMEIMSTIASIDAIEKNNDSVLFKLGGEAFVHGKVSDNKILVEVGAGVILEKSLEEGRDTLNKRKMEMEIALRNIQTNVAQVSNAMSQLGQEINGLLQKSQNPDK